MFAPSGRKNGFMLVIQRRNYITSSYAHTYMLKQTWKRLGYWLPVTSFLVLCQDEMIVCFPSVHKIGQPAGRGHSSCWMFPRCQTRRSDPSHKQKKNHPFALVRPCVMLLIPPGLQAFIQSRWKRNNDSIRHCWQMEVTRSKKSFHELEFRMNMRTCIFFLPPNTHIVEVLLCERGFSAGGRRGVLGFSLMAQFSCWDIKSLPLPWVFFFAHFPTRRHWHNDCCHQPDCL